MAGRSRRVVGVARPATGRNPPSAGGPRPRSVAPGPAGVATPGSSRGAGRGGGGPRRPDAGRRRRCCSVHGRRVGFRPRLRAADGAPARAPNPRGPRRRTRDRSPPGRPAHPLKRRASPSRTFPFPKSSSSLDAPNRRRFAADELRRRRADNGTFGSHFPVASHFYRIDIDSVEVWLARQGRLTVREMGLAGVGPRRGAGPADDLLRASRGRRRPARGPTAAAPCGRSGR